MTFVQFERIGVTNQIGLEKEGMTITEICVYHAEGYPMVMSGKSRA